MTSTSFAEFGARTEALAVANAFPDAIKGRTILITGVNKLGIGYATATALASQSPRTLILAGRSQAKLEECLGSLRSDYPNVDYRLVIVDLSSQKSVRKAATEVLSWDDVPAIDIEVNSAGVMMIPERTLSEDGIEMHLATNHVGHFLFTNLIMPKIIASAKTSTPGTTRIVNVSSYACVVSALRFSDISFEKPASQLPTKEKPNFPLLKMSGLAADEDMSYISMAAYGQSKCANALYTVALNEKLHEKYGVTSIVLHPGDVDTELQRSTDKEWREEAHKKMKIESKTLQQGASTSLVAALDPKLGTPSKEEYGQFLTDCQVGKVPPYVVDPVDADKLWAITEDMVKEKFAW